MDKIKYHYLHKINLTLPKKAKIKNIIKEKSRLKGKESPKTLDNTSNISMKNRKGNNEINFSANTPDENNDNLNQISNTYRDNTLQKISQKYSELINRINEDKKELQNINKIYYDFVHRTENSHKSKNISNPQKIGLKKNITKNKNINSLKNNYNTNYFDIHKKINKSGFLYGLSNFNTSKDQNNNPNKANDKKKTKQISFNKILPKPRTKDISSKKELNKYIRINNINSVSEENEKMLNKTINNNLNNSKKLKVKKNEKKIFNLRNEGDKIKIEKNKNMTPRNNLHFINKEKHVYENNNDKKIQMIKINNLDDNNFHKNNSSSAIYYSPDNFYHNIINFKQADNYINIENYNTFNNKNNINNNFKNAISLKKKTFNKENNLFSNKTDNLNNNKINKVINNKRNLKNIFKIKGNSDLSKNNNSNISSNYLGGNTISCLNSEEINKKENKLFHVNELFRRDEFSKNLTLQYIGKERKQTEPVVEDTPKKYFYQITDETNNFKKEKLLQKAKLKIPNNQNFKINRETINKIINKEKDNCISINYNNIDIDNKLELDNNTENSNFYYNKKKLDYINKQKNNLTTELYNKNILMNNNLIDSQNTVSSRVLYTDFTINNISSIKKDNNNIKNQIHRNKKIESSRRKLSNSFNREYNNEKESLNNNIYINNNTINNILNKDNYFYKRKNCSLLSNKEKKNMDRETMKNNKMYDCVYTEEAILDSKTQSNYDLINNNRNNSKAITIGKILYVKPLQLKSKSKSKKNENENNNNLYKQIESQNSLSNKFYLNNNNSLNIFPSENNNDNYFKNSNLRKIKNINNIFYSNNKINENESITNNTNNILEHKSNENNNKDNIYFNIIEKNNIHCFYKKLYNYFIKIPIQKVCFIEKKHKNKNFKNIKKTKNMCETDSNFAIIKNKLKELDNIKFNGKNIISKNEKLEGRFEKRIKVNGSDELLNFSNQKKEGIKQIHNNFIGLSKSLNILTENENINEIIPKKCIQLNFNPINKKGIYKNSLCNSTSKIPIKFTKISFFNKEELPKNIKICLATTKLNKIFNLKNERNDTIKKTKSFTEKNFVLGCSKLNNIFDKKSPNSNLYLGNTQQFENFNNTKFSEKKENEINTLESNNRIQINKKAFTYKPNRKLRLPESEEFNKEELENNNKENKIKDIKSIILNLLKTIKNSNINSISDKIVKILLYSNSVKIVEKIIILVNALFEMIYNEDCDLYLYSQLCNKINNLLLNEYKNNININEENNLIDIILKEFYKKIDDSEYIYNLNIGNEKKLESLQNKFIEIISFISELVLIKLIKKEDSFNMIQELFNKYEKNKENYIFLKGVIYLIDSLLKTLDFPNSKDIIIILENFVEKKIKGFLQEENISIELKNKIYNIIGLLNQINQEKRKNNNIFKSNNFNKIDNKETYLNRLNSKSLNSEKKYNNNNHINLFINATFKKKNENNIDENGGTDIIDKNIFEEVSFKIDTNESNRKNQLNLQNCKTNNIIFINEKIYKEDDKYKLNLENKVSDNSNTKKDNNNSHKKKSKSKKKDIKNLNLNKKELVNEQNIYKQIEKDLENFLEFLTKNGIKTENDPYIDINYSYNWKVMDDLIMVNKVKLEDIIKIIIEITKNKTDVNINDIFKINEYIKTILEYYSNNLSDNQINIFHLNMIELYIGIDDIIKNSINSEIMYKILGNLFFILLKNKLCFIKDLNNFIDKNKETQINIAKVVKYCIISSGNLSKQYFNDFKYTKLFNNNSDLFVNCVANELTDLFKK